MIGLCDVKRCDIYMYVYIVISRDYVRGQGLRDVWASNATLIVRAGVQRRLDWRYYWCGRVVQRFLYHGRYLRGHEYRDRLY